MSIVSAPFIDKYGCIQIGIIMCSYNLIMTIPMLLFWDSFIGLLIARILGGMFTEATFLIQCQIIVQYFPSKLEGLGFGICVSIATSANLIGYFVIPIIMKGYIPGYWSDDPNQYVLWEAKLKMTFWLNTIVAGFVLFFFVISSIPLLMEANKRKRQSEEKRNANRAV